MRNHIVLVALLICLGPYGASSATNITDYMEDYIVQNQRQYDAKVKKFDDELAIFKDIYTRELRAISVLADQLEIKLDEAKARLNPIELISAWHKQCVQNYSANMPLIASVRGALTSCSTTAQNNVNSILTNSQSTLNSLRGYYNSNLKTLLSDCARRNPVSQSNYTICIMNAITTANAYTVNNQKSFNTFMQQAKCAADTRITQAWECAFATVHSSSSTLGAAMRLIDDCLGNAVACASCKNHMVINLRDSDFLNTTIKNPFLGLDYRLGCLELKFKRKL